MYFALWEGNTVELSTMMGRRDGEIFAQAGLFQEEMQLRFVEVDLEVVGRHPS